MVNLIKHIIKSKIVTGLFLMGVFILSHHTANAYVSASTQQSLANQSAAQAAQREQRALLDRLLEANTVQSSVLANYCDRADTPQDVKNKCASRNRAVTAANDGRSVAGQELTLEQRVGQAQEAARLSQEIIASAGANANLDQESRDQLDQIGQNLDQAGQPTPSPTATTKPKPKGTCTFSWSFSLMRCIDMGIAWLFTLIGWVFSWVLWLANLVFNISIVVSIKNFSSIANMPGVLTGWRIIRDLMNLVFIASLFYIAISTILQTSNANWKKQVPSIVIAALLINFSMLFTRVMIDASNLLAFTFYSNLAPAGAVTGAPDISTELFQNMNLLGNEKLTMGSIKPGAPDGDPGLDNLTTWEIISGGIGKIVMYLVASFVLIVAAILFIIRTVVLTFLLILSPLAFIGMIMPKFASHGSKWWGELSNQLIFAPAYMVCFFVVVQIIRQSQGLKTAIGNEGSVIMFFIIINGLLLGCIFIAKSMGVKGTAFAEKIAKPLTTGAGLAIGGAAVRNTIGRGAAKLGDDNRFIKALSLNNAPVVGGLGRIAARGMKAGLGTITAKTGYDAKLEREAKEAKEFKKPNEALRYMSGLNADSRKKVYEDMTADQKIGLENEIKRQEEVRYRTQNSLPTTGPLSPAHQAALNAQVARNSQMMTLTDLRQGLSAEKQAEIIKRRTNATDQLASFASVPDANKQNEIFEKLSAYDRAAIIREVDAQVARGVAGSAANQAAINRAKGLLTPEEKAKTDEEGKKQKNKDDLDRNKVALQAAGITPAAAKTILDTMSHDQISDLGPEILSLNHVIEHLDQSIVEKAQGKMNQAQRDNVYSFMSANRASVDPNAFNYVMYNPKGASYRNSAAGRAPTPTSAPTPPSWSNPRNITFTNNRWEATDPSGGQPAYFDGKDWIRF